MFARPVGVPQHPSAGSISRSNMCPVLARCSAFLVFEVVGFFIEADFGLRPYCILIIYYKTKQIKIPTLLKKPHKFLCLLFFLMNSVLVNWACISFYMGVLLWKDLK